jgi:hypothetical protein
LRTFISCALIAAGYLGLSACSTLVEIQVPQSEIKNFGSCVAKPWTSYSRTKPAAGFNPALVTPTQLTLPVLDAANNQLFITNDQISTSTEALLTDVKFEDSAEAQTITSSGAFATTGELAAAASDADAIWDSHVHQLFLRAFNDLSNTSKAAPQTPSSLKSGDLLDYLRLVRSASLTDSWGAFAAKHHYLLDKLNKAPPSNDPKTQGQMTLNASLEAQKFAVGTFVSAYLKAYFRNGQFVQLNWNLGNPLTDLEKLAGTTNDAKITKLLSDLKTLDPTAEADLDGLISKQISGTIGKIGAAGLITRGGDSLAMPAVTLTADVTQPKIFQSTKVDANAVLEDLVRVTFEGVFDALNQIPATTNSTGTASNPAGSAAPGGVLSADVALADFSKVYPVYNPTQATVMSTDSFALVDSDGAKAHSATSTAVATLIRGGSVAALNNEAVANALAAAAGTTARKMTERVTWCYYAVVPQTALSSAAAVASAGPKSTKTVAFKLTY